MAATKGKRIAMWTGAATLVVLVATGLALKDRLWEEWWLYRLEHGDEDEKCMAADRLGELGSLKAVPLLAALLKTESTSLHFAALLSLSGIDSGAKAAVPAIREFLSDGFVRKSMEPRPNESRVDFLTRQVEQGINGAFAHQLLLDLEAADADSPR